MMGAAGVKRKEGSSESEKEKNEGEGRNGRVSAGPEVVAT
jgi:hypothetical protein